MAFRVARPFSVDGGHFAEGHLVQAADVGVDAAPGLVDGGFLVEVADAAPAPVEAPAGEAPAPIEEPEAEEPGSTEPQ